MKYFFKLNTGLDFYMYYVTYLTCSPYLLT
jgi:hypothetical protein